ncbi:hypothetical protein AMECASPLE_015755 [Ameca splendens]|uniref:Uncharacterized protein n=1 Tax=Ameca splendens TaxID=208324 RepID=A0ABV0YZX9_9TELE
MFLKVTLDNQAWLRSEDSYPVIYLCLDLHQAGSFLSSSSPEPSHKRNLSTLQRKPPHIELVYCNLSSTEQYQVNSLQIYLLKTWILNLIPPGDLTTITQQMWMTDFGHSRKAVRKAHSLHTDRVMSLINHVGGLSRWGTQFQMGHQSSKRGCGLTFILVAMVGN